MIVATNGREKVTAEHIRKINELDWDEKHYANFKFADGNWGLEVTYYQHTRHSFEFRYRVDCADEMEMHALRAELDERSYLNEKGFSVQKR